MGTGQKSEGKFKAWCNSKGYYTIKLRIDLSHLKVTGKVFSTAMPADFVVVTPEQTKFVEVKEIEFGDRFDCRRFHQQFKLYKLAKHYENDVMNGYVLLNFMHHKLVCYFQIDEYNDLVKKLGNKSFTIKQIPDKHKCTWDTLLL